MLSIIELIIRSNNALIDAILTILVIFAIIFCMINNTMPYIVHYQDLYKVFDLTQNIY